LNEEIIHIIPEYSIQDERFDISQIVESELIIETGPGLFRIAVKDTHGYFRILEDYSFPGKHPSEKWLDALFSGHRLLSARFWKNIKWLVHSENKTRVPCSVSIEKADELLKAFIPGVAECDDRVLVQADEQCSYVYTANKQTDDFLHQFYTGKGIETISADCFLATHFSEPVLLFYPDGYGYFDSKNSYFSNRIEALFPLFNKELTIHVFGEVTKYSRKFRELEHDFKLILGVSDNGKMKLSQYFSESPVHRYFCILMQ
jgi:hypothetical protein